MTTVHFLITALSRIRNQIDMQYKILYFGCNFFATYRG